MPSSSVAEISKYDFLSAASAAHLRRACRFYSMAGIVSYVAPTEREKMPAYHPKKTPASNALTDLIRAVIRMNATVQKSGTRLTQGMALTNARWQVLAELSALEKRVTVSELARHMGLTRQAVQRLADEMVGDDLLAFVENPGDARAMHLVVTETGDAIYSEAGEREWQWANGVAESFDGEEIARAATLLESVTKKIQDGL